MEPVQPITDEQLPKLLAALAEAARADRRTAARFVPPRIGILEETATRRHQFVLGRRGEGCISGGRSSGGPLLWVTE